MIGGAVSRSVLQRLPTATAVARLSLGNGGVPTSRTLHTIKVRARVTVSTGTTKLKVALYEGATNRSGDLITSTLTTSLALYTLAISNVNAAAITDYSNLEIRFWGESTGDSSNIEIADIWLETPLAAESPDKIGSDFGTGTENASVSTGDQKVASDFGSVIEAAILDIGTIHKLGSDTGSGSEGELTLEINDGAADGTGTDVVQSLAVQSVASESGTSIEQATVTVSTEFKVASDGNSLVAESSVINNNNIVTDTDTVISESSFINNNNVATDADTLIIESSLINNVIVATDSDTLANESSFINNVIIVTDAETLITESIAMVHSAIRSDDGAGLEIAILGNPVFASDAASGQDHVLIFQRLIEDSASSVDSEAIAAQLISLDANISVIEFADVNQFIVGGVLPDVEYPLGLIIDSVNTQLWVVSYNTGLYMIDNSAGLALDDYAAGIVFDNNTKLLLMDESAGLIDIDSANESELRVDANSETAVTIIEYHIPE